MDKTKNEITTEIQKSFSAVFDYCTNLTEDMYWEEKEQICYAITKARILKKLMLY